MNKDERVSSFLTALQEFSNLDPDKAIHALFQMFSVISQSHDDELIAIVQTLDTFKNVSSLNQAQISTLESLRKSVCDRAKYLAKGLKDDLADVDRKCPHGDKQGYLRHINDNLSKLQQHFSNAELNM